jgi:lipid II:glycine glycyltransferase (peptidoglycan interpeptide bridge formation enzyme)
MKELSQKYDVVEIPSFVYMSKEDLAGFKMKSDDMKTLFVDLKNVDKTFKSMEKRTRYEINKAQKAGLRVFESNSIKDFDNLHQKTFEKQGKTRKVSTEFIVSFFNNLNKEKKVKLYFAENKEGELSAGAIFVWDNKRAYYLMASSDPKLLGDGAPSLIIWKAFCDFNEMSVYEMDLAGANVPAIEKFKRGFSGKVFPYQIFKK